MQLTISFNLDNFSSTEYILLFTVKHLPFAPKAISSNLSYKDGYHVYEANEAIELIKLNNDSSFRIADEIYSDYTDEINSVLYKREPVKNLQYLIFTFDNLNTYWLNHLIRDAHKIGFFMAFYKDNFKSLFQDEMFISNYIHTGKHYNKADLKMHWHPIFSPIFNEEVIDIFYNPGHSIMTYNTWLMAAPEMWFSNNSWQYFDKQKLKSYSKAILVEEIEENLVYIKLFDAETEDYEKPDILNLQADFRMHSKMNEVEKELEILSQENHKKQGEEGVAMHTIIIN